MEIQKLIVEVESGRWLTGNSDVAVVTVRVKSWDAPEMSFRQGIPLDSFETQFDRFMEIARRGIQSEVERIKGDQLPLGDMLARNLEAMKNRNETGDQGVPRA